MTEMKTALDAWVPLQIKAALHVCESTTATDREIFTAQGALKMLRSLQRGLRNPALEFGTLWPLSEEDEGEET